MKRPLLLTTLTACILGSGCGYFAADCEKLANRGCALQGNGSEACIEVRNRAHLATDEDQRYCREALAIIESRGGKPKHEPDGPN